MGSSETDTPSKLQPKTSSAQEQASAASSSPVPAVYPDWSGFQAYSPIPPHGFFHSPVASSPQAHPYMWGAQHLMSPYGTPPPYVMYPPPGGLYAHPSLPPGAHPFGPYAMPSPNGTVEVSGSVAAVAEVDGKSSEGKERSPIKRSRGSLGSLNMITGKTNNELGKTSGASANGAYSQSGESGTEGSSNSDANSQNDSEPKTSSQHGSLGAEASHNGTTQGPSQNGLGHAPSQTLLNKTIPVMTVPAVGAPAGIAGPTTNLNIGMDYWGTTTPSAINSTRGKNPATSGPGSVVPGVIPGHRENLSSEIWMQDEREVKRQKRKQSNRESARRSRLRKQAECEELAQRVESMKEENNALRAELDRFRKEYDKLLDENTSLKERVEGTPKAAEGTMFEKNDKHPGNGGHQHTNSDARADTMQNGR